MSLSRRQDPTSPCSLTWLRFIIPLSLITLSTLLLVLHHLPRPIKRVLRPLTDIFNDPASLASVAELPESLLKAPEPESEGKDANDQADQRQDVDRPPPARTTIFSPQAVLRAFNDTSLSLGWRHVAFITIGALQAAFWFGWMGWSIAFEGDVRRNVWKIWMSVGVAVSWVSPNALFVKTKEK